MANEPESDSGMSALIVVASPALLKSRAPILAAADCLGFPLLHDGDRADWRLWFEAQAVKVPRDLKGPSFSDDHLMGPTICTDMQLHWRRNMCTILP